MELTDYYTIKKRVKYFGKEDEVKKYAEYLQIKLSEASSEGVTIVPFEDAYEMAYYELIQPKFY